MAPGLDCFDGDWASGGHWETTVEQGMGGRHGWDEGRKGNRGSHFPMRVGRWAVGVAEGAVRRECPVVACNDARCGRDNQVLIRMGVISMVGIRNTGSFKASKM